MRPVDAAHQEEKGQANGQRLHLQPPHTDLLVRLHGILLSRSDDHHYHNQKGLKETDPH